MSASVAEIKAALVMHRGDVASAAEELLAGPKMGPRKPKTHSMKTRIGRGLSLEMPLAAPPESEKKWTAVLKGPAYWKVGRSIIPTLLTTTFLFQGQAEEDAKIMNGTLFDSLYGDDGGYQKLADSLKSSIRSINQTNWKFDGIPWGRSPKSRELEQKPIRHSDAKGANTVSINVLEKTATVVFGDQSDVLDFGLGVF